MLQCGVQMTDYMDRKEEVFHSVMRIYHRPLYIYLFGKTQDKDAADDLIQEVWMRVFRSGEKVDINPAWVYGVAKNCLKQWYRDRTRFAKAKKHLGHELATETDPQNELETRRRLVLAAINDLPEEASIVVSMKYLNQMSCAEIAAALEKPLGTVKSTLSRSYDTLREVLSKKFKEMEE